MQVFYRLLIRLLIVGPVCFLTIGQTICPSPYTTLFDAPAVVINTPAFAIHAVEEVGSSPVVDAAGVSTTSSSSDAGQPEEAQAERPILYRVEAGTQWTFERRFHRRIPPRSGAEDN